MPWRPFHRYQKLVLSIALRIVRDPGEAEDVTRLFFWMFIVLWHNSIPAKAILRCGDEYAYHRAINRRQHLQGREFYRNADLEESETRPAEVHAPFGLSSPETQALVRQSLDALPDKQKSVIQLACYEGLSMREIAPDWDSTRMSATIIIGGCGYCAL